MAHEIQFSRNIDNVLASASEIGLLVVAGWTMAIPKSLAIEYVKTYNENPNAGFFEHGDNIVLSHNEGKLMLSPQEAAAVVELIKAAYGPF